METYFIRHILHIDDENFNNLSKSHLIAIHYPRVKYGNTKSDTKSLNPEDYKGKAKQAMSAFVNLAEQGGYVCAEYLRSHPGALIGKVYPNTKIQFHKCTYSDEDKKQGEEAILKTLPLKEVRYIEPPEYVRISAGRPQRGNIAIWHNAVKRIESLVENKPLEHILQNLFPAEQEVLCSEFLRSALDETGFLPKAESFLLPVGGTLKDVDIIGFKSKSEKIYAQVTYSEFESKKSESKFEKLKKYKSENTIAILFCNCSKPDKNDNIIVYPLQMVFDSYCKSDIGERWLKMIFSENG